MKLLGLCVAVLLFCIWIIPYDSEALKCYSCGGKLGPCGTDEDEKVCKPPKDKTCNVGTWENNLYIKGCSNGTKSGKKCVKVCKGKGTSECAASLRVESCGCNCFGDLCNSFDTCEGMDDREDGNKNVACNWFANWVVLSITGLLGITSLKV